jgi:hypothetical protein
LHQWVSGAEAPIIVGVESSLPPRHEEAADVPIPVLDGVSTRHASDPDPVRAAATLPRLLAKDGAIVFRDIAQRRLGLTLKFVIESRAYDLALAYGAVHRLGERDDHVDFVRDLFLRDSPTSGRLPDGKPKDLPDALFRDSSDATATA